MSNVRRIYITNCLANTNLQTQSIGLIYILLDVEKIPKVGNLPVLTYKNASMF